MNAQSIREDPAVLSYLALRKAVGIIALALPFALMAGNILLTPLGPTGTWPNPLFQGSISDYYYTPMGNFLVGSLCAIAMFLTRSSNAGMCRLVMTAMETTMVHPQAV